MQRIVQLTNLYSQQGADKIQDIVKRMLGVKSVRVNFQEQNMRLETSGEDFDFVFHNIKYLIKQIEPEVTVRW